MWKDTIDLANWARECGLRLSTYSPGDGVTRYRFAAPEDQRISERVSDTAQTIAAARETLASNYFACSAIATVLGRKAAAEWLSAYSIGYRRGRRQAAHEAELADDEQFFYKHAAYGYDPSVDDSDEAARVRCARDLAKAERDGRAAGLTFSWEGDPEGAESCACGEDHGPAYVCLCYRPNSNPDSRRGDEWAASLSGIQFSSGSPKNEPYARVVEAELAMEALSS